MGRSSAGPELDRDRILRAGADRRLGAPVPFARSSALAPFVDFLETTGAPVDRWLGQARIAPWLLDDPEALVPCHSAYRFVELSAREEHLEDLGMIVGQRTSALDLGAFGRALQGTATVHEYLRTGIRLIGAHSSGTRLWLTAAGDGLRVNQYLKGPPGLGRCVADLYTLVITLSTLRRFIGPDWCPEEIRLLAGDEALLGDRAAFGDSRLITRQRHSSFTVSRSLLDRPLPGRGGQTSPAGAGPALAGDPIPGDFLGSIAPVIMSLMNDCRPGIQTCAEVAGMSPRTLQRRLAEAGTSYSSLVQASRMRLAEQWLSASDRPIAEIAAALGYTDASNFARAFRREAGASPRAYRRRGAPR